MGKNSKHKKRGESEHSPSTVFVSNLPYSFTNPLLEDTFSDVGPIRRCFMVTKTGSTEHRGIGIVQFAVAEDAARAIELKNGSDVGGRKINVKHAAFRAPLEQRRAKANQVSAEQSKDDDVKALNDAADAHTLEDAAISKTGVTSEDRKTGSSEGRGEVKLNEPKRSKSKRLLVGLNDEGNTSEKQRVARTVILGGILNDKIYDEVIRRAKEIEGVCSVTYPLPKEDLQHHGLAQEGCKVEAAAVLYASVRSARAAVAKLHDKKIEGAFLWARQLGGEGSKTQKWKLIVRNLPFKIKANDIREKFSEVGFVWDAFVPQDPEKRLFKGFAFIKFTSKQDAENAIQKFNGQQFGNRTIAVDWAVPKKLYTSGANSAMDLEDGQKDSNDGDSDLESPNIPNNDHSDNKKSIGKSDVAGVDLDHSEAKEDMDATVDFGKEAEIAHKVLKTLISSAKDDPDGSSIATSHLKKDAESRKKIGPPSDLLDESVKLSNEVKHGAPSKTKQTNMKPSESEEDLQNTVFIGNLPFDVDPEEVKQRFLGFGEVLSFVPVLHPVTKQPKGTGFLKFKVADAATAAVTAADAAMSTGIFLKGRQLNVFKALDKKAAHNKALDKSKKEDHDHRNLYLAKEGLIVEDTPAASGVSASDMAKRKSLERKKTEKLQSPNCHVSRTRLIIYNIPKPMTEKELKELCLHAVTSRATKQNPIIRQVKILKDEKKAKVKEGNVKLKNHHSRGVGFVEFGEHQHALVALRVLNNNPETFGSEHRPIVEFAIDNIQTLRQRQQKMSLKKNNAGVDVQHRNDSSTKDPGEKRGRGTLRLSGGPDSRKRTREERSKGSVDSITDEPETTKIRKINPGRENENLDLKVKAGKKIMKHQEMKKGNHVRQSHGGNRDIIPREPKRVDVQPKKSKGRDFWDEAKDDQGAKKRTRNKKNKDGGAGHEVMDKLDRLIEQYRTKFSQRSSGAGDEAKQGARPIRRWFQS
ncbi:RNA-binding protein 28-like protein [Drosera capensis]